MYVQSGTDKQAGLALIAILERGLAKNKSELARRLNSYPNIINSIMKGERGASTDLLERLVDEFAINPRFIFGKTTDVELFELPKNTKAPTSPEQGEKAGSHQHPELEKLQDSTEYITDYSTEYNMPSNQINEGKGFNEELENYASEFGWSPELHKDLKNRKKELLRKALERTPSVVVVDPGKRIMVPMLDAQAAAGYPAHMNEPEYLAERPLMHLPGPEFESGNYIWIQVRGDSMEGTVDSGDWVLAKQLYSLNEIKEGYVHIIVTRDGVQAKRLLNRLERDNRIILISDNKTYRPEPVHPSEILQVWIAKAFMSYSFKNRNMGYQEQINDLNARMALLEEHITGKKW